MDPEPAPATALVGTENSNSNSDLNSNSKSVSSKSQAADMLSSASSQWSSSPSSSDSEEPKPIKELPPPLPAARKRLSKQLSMCDTSREAAWERRRKQFMRRQRSLGRRSFDEEAAAAAAAAGRPKGWCLTDADLHELRGFIDLGFEFTEEDHQSLASTLPALDLYFAVTRQLSRSSASQVSTPGSSASLTTSDVGSPKSPVHQHGAESNWKIVNPGDNPQHVKTKLRHWAQIVACSVKQIW